MTRAVSKVQQAVVSAKARAELRAAKEKRPGIVEALTSVFAPSTDELRQRIIKTIAGNLQGTAQAAYFRKLEEAASEDDLRGLLDDIERLEALTDDDEMPEANG